MRESEAIHFVSLAQAAESSVGDENASFIERLLAAATLRYLEEWATVQRVARIELEAARKEARAAVADCGLAIISLSALVNPATHAFVQKLLAEWLHDFVGLDELISIGAASPQHFTDHFSDRAQRAHRLRLDVVKVLRKQHGRRALLHVA
jgi:hypothetical protein